MIIKLGHNEYTFPDTWEQLKPAEYLQLSQQLLLFANGKTTEDELRAMFFCSITGIEFKRKDNKNELLWQNVYRASREFTFFLKIDYEKDLRGVDKPLRKQLYRRLPDDINSTDPILRWVKKLDYKYAIDASFSKNLLPAIKVADKHYYGYTFELISKFLKCSLSAQQFISANSALDAYMRDNNDDDLCLLVSILYSNGENPQSFKKLDAVVKFGVLLNFQAIVAFLTKRTKYTIIWHRSATTKKTDTAGKKITVGAGDSILTLAKMGYGNIDEIKSLNLIDYLNILLKNIVDSVLYLHNNEQNVAQIAEKTGVSIPIINQII